MVITLRNGAQIRADVEDFSTDWESRSGELRKLNWTRFGGYGPHTELNWIDLKEIAAVHAEYDGTEPSGEFELDDTEREQR